MYEYVRYILYLTDHMVSFKELKLDVHELLLQFLMSVCCKKKRYWKVQNEVVRTEIVLNYEFQIFVFE